MFNQLGVCFVVAYFFLTSERCDCQCPNENEKIHVLTCEQALTELVTSKLTQYNKTIGTINLNNVTEAEWVTEKTKEVVCLDSNAALVSCLVGNLTACPRLMNDSDVASAWIASVVSKNLDVLNSTHAICTFFNDVSCSHKEERLNKCYISVVGETITVNAVYGPRDICPLDKRNNLTCMIQAYRYKECHNYFNLTANTIINTNIKILMLKNQWETFDSGSELCDCYEGSECYKDLHHEITAFVTTNSSVTVFYTKAVGVSEILCSNISRVNCSLKSRPQACQNILMDYSISRTKITVYKSTVDSICHTLHSDKFQEDKQCIIQKLSEVYHPCIAEADLMLPIVDCGDARKLYNCCKAALNGQCNGDYVNTAYEIMRSSLGTVPVCDVPSPTKSGARKYFVTEFLLIVAAGVMFFEVK